MTKEEYRNFLKNGYVSKTTRKKITDFTIKKYINKIDFYSEKLCKSINSLNNDFFSLSNNDQEKIIDIYINGLNSELNKIKEEDHHTDNTGKKNNKRTNYLSSALNRFKDALNQELN